MPDQFLNGPIYCETLSAQIGHYPVEFYNTLSNGVIVLFGILGLYYVRKLAPKAYDLYLLCALLIATGIGSGVWHGLRDSGALFWEVRSGLFFLFAIVFCWARRLWSYPGAILALGAFYFGYDYASQFGGVFGISGRWVAITPLVLGMGAVMVTQTAFRAKDAALTGTLALVCALVAIIFRTIDIQVCRAFPIGTHFLWHSFLSFGGFLGILTLIRIPAWAPSWLRSKDPSETAAQ